MNIIEIAIIAVIAVAVFCALRRVVKMRKSGCACCSGCCAECGGGCGKTCRREEGSKTVR